MICGTSISHHKDTEDTEKSLIKGIRIHHRDTEDTEESLKVFVFHKMLMDINQLTGQIIGARRLAVLEVLP